MEKFKEFKTGADFEEIKEYPGRKGKCFTTTTFVPIRDKILIKAVWEESPLVVKSEEKVRNTNPEYTIVVGLGDEVEGIKIHDEVGVGFNAVIEPVEFDNNDQSIKKKQELLGNIKLPQNSRKIYMVEYYCVPYNSILGIITDE